ncbi:MAG: ABC transporter ATP-binding protein [Thermodesulfobacteriota bacterium]|nr:ABC transporter ATP-binding protein [Thermodesulfobacteriota bacterium]
MGMIDVSKVSFKYIEEWVLKEVSFSVGKGEFLGVIGPNGSGKTTLLKSLNKTIVPQQGDISVDGVNIKNIKRRELARVLSMVPQESPSVFPFSVMEMVLMGRAPYLSRLSFEGEEDYEIARRAMKMTDTIGFAARGMGELSGGEKQRILIARAIAQEPDVMLLDEPTSFLDITHQIEIYDLIKGLSSANGLTVVIVSHDINLAAQYCNRILLLDKGGVRRIGTPEQVITRENIEGVYGCRVLVDRNSVTDSPRVTPLSKNTETFG